MASNTVQKAAIASCFNAGASFDRAEQEAKQRMNVDGVSEVYKQIEENYQAYTIQRDSFIEQNQPRLDELYSVYFEASKKRDGKYKVSKIALLVLVVFIVINFTPLSSLFSGLLGLLAGTVIFAGSLIVIVIYLVLGGIQSSRTNSELTKYEECFSELRSKASIIVNQYAKTAASLQEDVDNLYLASLDPAHREMVLMRRDQAEQARKQEEHNKKEAERNRQLAEEQRRREEERLKIEQERLQIERDREARVKRY